LSYYSDAAIGRHLNLDASALATARAQLVQADLIAYSILKEFVRQVRPVRMPPA
jgi:hypothetical protein